MGVGAVRAGVFRPDALLPRGADWDQLAQEQSDSAGFEMWTDIAAIYKFNERLRYDGDRCSFVEYDADWSCERCSGTELLR